MMIRSPMQFEFGRSTLLRAATSVVFAVLSVGAVATAQEKAYPPLVDQKIARGVKNGLEWLARNQGPDGSWRNEGGYGTYPAAMTGLAGMAFLASGSTATRGPYYKNVRNATDFLIRNSDARSGVISVPAEEGRSMYGHGFATLFLASAYGMEEDLRKQHRLKVVLDKAVKLISRSQSSAGGWIYTPDSNGDEGSVTVTQVQALRACRMSGIVVDKKTVDRAVSYIKRCQQSDGGISYRLNSGGGSRAPISAAGVAVLYNAGIYDDQPFATKAYDYCKKNISVTTGTTGHHFYAHLYWSQAIYQRGGDDWKDYYGKMSKWMLRQQRKNGAWDGNNVGAVYGTAVALTILQLPYSLVPIYQR